MKERWGVAGFLRYMFILGMAYIGSALAEEKAVYDPNVLHYGDYVKLRYVLTKIENEKPSVYLSVAPDKAPVLAGAEGAKAADDELDVAPGEPTVRIEDSPSCFWIVLPENGKSLNSVYAQEVAPDDKIRLEHVVKGGRLYVEGDSITRHGSGFKVVDYSLTDETSNGEIQVLSLGALKIGSECKLKLFKRESDNYLVALPGESFSSFTQKNSKLGLVSYEDSGNWTVDDIYPMSRLMSSTENIKNAPPQIFVSYDQGMAEHLRIYANSLKLSPLQSVQTASAFMKVARVSDSRFFAITHPSGLWRYLANDGMKVAFTDQNMAPRTDWIFIPDNDGFLKVMNRINGGYLARPMADWADGNVWTTLNNEAQATFEEGMSFVLHDLQNLTASVLVSEDASSAVYDPVEDSPYTPIFNPAWELPVPGPGDKNTIELSLSMKQYNELDNRDLYIAFSGLTKLTANDIVHILIDKNKFEVKGSLYKTPIISQKAAEDDNSANPQSSTFGRKVVTTRAEGDDPAETIKFVVELYGPLNRDGTPRLGTHLVVKKISASGDSVTFEEDELNIPSNAIHYFGLGGAASKIIFKDIKINGERKTINDATLAPDELVNLSEAHTAIPGDIAIHRVAVGSRPVTKQGEVKGQYMAWAIGNPGTSYEGKLYQLKKNEEISSWIEHEALLQGDDSSKKKIENFIDIACSDDGKVFAATLDGKLYKYNWPVDENSSGSWSLYSFKDEEGNDLKAKQIAVGRTRVVQVDVKKDSGETVKEEKRLTALFVVAQVDSGSVRVYQSADAADPAAAWIKRSGTINDVMMSVASYDVALALNDQGDAFVLKRVGEAQKTSWEPLIMKLVLKSTDDKGKELITKEDVTLSYIAAGGAGLIFGIANATESRGGMLLVRYEKEAQGWVPVEDEDKKDMVGVVSLSINEAGSTIMIDSVGRSYQSEQIGVTVVVPDESGDSVTVTAGEEEDIKAEVPEEVEVKTSEVEDTEKPADIVTEEGEESASPVSSGRSSRPVRSRSIRTRAGSSGVGMPRSGRSNATFGATRPESSGRPSRPGRPTAARPSRVARPSTPGAAGRPSARPSRPGRVGAVTPQAGRPASNSRLAASSRIKVDRSDRSELKTSGASPRRTPSDRSSAASPRRTSNDRSSGASPRRTSNDRSSGASPRRTSNDRSSSASPRRTSNDRSSAASPRRTSNDRSSGLDRGGQGNARSRAPRTRA